MNVTARGFSGRLTLGSVRPVCLFFVGLLVANLSANRVFLLIERFLLRGRYMTVVELRHCPLFPADGPIFAVKLMCFTLRNFAFVKLAINSPILIFQTIIDLITTWVITFPFRPSHRVHYGDSGEHDA